MFKLLKQLADKGSAAAGYGVPTACTAKLDIGSTKFDGFEDFSVINLRLQQVIRSLESL